MRQPDEKAANHRRIGFEQREERLARDDHAGRRLERNGARRIRTRFVDRYRADRVTGTALDFALVVTQRRLPADTALAVDGDDARTWIAFAQAFAGNPTDTDPTRARLARS